MRILVLGAGVVGTTSAWYLVRAGHEVTVVDRQPIAGNETSFANGGQISVSHAEPWANPHVLPRILRWLGREDAPLRWHWRADWAQWLWGLRFLGECLPDRTRRNIGAIVRLALHSRTCLQALRAELNLDYDALQRGILHFYTDPREFEQAQVAAAVMREFGLDRHPIDADRCIAIEPALADARPLLVGGDFTPSDESGDAHRFTQALAAEAAARGVDFRFETTVDRILRSGDVLSGVAVRQGRAAEAAVLTADAYVLALGSYSPLLTRPLGFSLPIIPGKGYSATLQLAEGSPAPMVSLTDDGYKLVFSRLGQRLRIAGTAEFAGYDLALHPARCAPLITRTRQLFPKLNSIGEPRFWCGLRPVTPSNLPFIGQSPLRNLWLNTGHGTLGWTMACGSAAVLAELIDGRRPDIDFPFSGFAP